MTGIQIAWEDVFSVISQISGWLIAIGIALVAWILVLVFAGKAGKKKARLIRMESVIAFVAVVALLVNGIIFQPLYNMISMVFTEVPTLSDDTLNNSKSVVERVTGEGIVLTKNDGTLPLRDTTKINVFGWASTNPVYGGTGSGTVDASTAVTLLGGLANARFETNTELSDFYTAYRSDRPAITINNGQDCVKANVELGGAAAGYPLAVMSSYIYVGTTWDGGCDALLNQILRTEWGFEGMVLTDYFGNYGYMDADKAIRGGSDIMLGTAGNDAILTDQTSATSIQAMRTACKNVLYTVVNSSAYNDENYAAAKAMPDWVKVAIGVDVALAAVLIAAEVLCVRSYKKKED